jgi:hypothetical protein
VRRSLRRTGHAQNIGDGPGRKGPSDTDLRSACAAALLEIIRPQQKVAANADDQMNQPTWLDRSSVIELMIGCPPFGYGWSRSAVERALDDLQAEGLITIEVIRGAVIITAADPSVGRGV